MAELDSTSALTVAELSVRHGARVVVDNASFDLKTGHSFGIVGESGCGKSTILKAIAGINDNWSGSISVFGHALTRRRRPADRRLLQIVFQDPLAALNPAHTVDEALLEPMIIHGLADRERQIRAVLDAVALPSTVRFRFPAELSGGQRQRVCIARALLVDPKLLLLDEPTSALDLSVQAEILNLLSTLQAQRGLTMVLVSHDLAVVAHMCERIGIMRNGRFSEILSREQLLAFGGHSSWRQQFFSGPDETARKVVAPFKASHPGRGTIRTAVVADIRE